MLKGDPGSRSQKAWGSASLRTEQPVRRPWGRRARCGQRPGVKRRASVAGDELVGEQWGLVFSSAQLRVRGVLCKDLQEGRVTGRGSKRSSICCFVPQMPETAGSGRGLFSDGKRFQPPPNSLPVLVQKRNLHA